MPEQIRDGRGDPHNMKVNSDGSINTVERSNTAFGEVSMAEPTPQVQVQFPYNINTAQLIIFPGNGGTITNGRY